MTVAVTKRGLTMRSVSSCGVIMHTTGPDIQATEQCRSIWQRCTEDMHYSWHRGLHSTALANQLLVCTHLGLCSQLFLLCLLIHNTALSQLKQLPLKRLVRVLGSLQLFCQALQYTP